ncbi:GGDEF domain-containing protein [Paenibacillus sp. GP183]|uniref:GGDEF domain-containing protein n=1 Tax=Paenibacillus sp. GP183 TaxID=1882751 RepID=UPI00089A9E0D|nr:GGDEF domain-containing protein [Paenibacillus sp. GP183]SEB98614.1 diguanylate cyclase (GGDEF) domain-containing protein [Paenibacillus sp. GP183]
MKYSGRIVIISVVVILILAIRTYGSLYYNYPSLQFPLIGVILVFASWLLGTQYDKLKFLSERDVLTNLYNRRFLLYTFPKLIASVDRKQEKLIVYFIDVDDFKIINDTRGHEIGDRVLQRIANVLTLHSQKRDIVVRWAGDEFLILSPLSDDRNKAKTISLIQNELKLSSQELDIAISVSIGTATYPNEAQTLDDLLHAADQGMYILKSDNKNQLKFISN